MRPESSDSAARTELREMVGAARSFQRTASLPGAHARASLPGPFAQDWRNALVRGELAGAMGRAVELFGLGTEEIGRASCREEVAGWVVGGPVKEEGRQHAEMS